MRSDEKGLFVVVQPNGSVWWRFKYRYAGREQLLSLGTYPDVSLKRAREKRDDAPKLLDRDINPSADRKAKKAALASTDTFKSVAKDWMKKGCPPRKRPASSLPIPANCRRSAELTDFVRIANRVT